MKNAVNIFQQKVDEVVPTLDQLDEDCDYEFLVHVEFEVDPHDRSWLNGINVIVCCPDEGNAWALANEKLDELVGFRQDVKSMTMTVLHEIVADDEPECWQEGPMPVELLAKPFNPRHYWEAIAYESAFESPLGWASFSDIIPPVYREMCREAYDMGWKDRLAVNKERGA